MLLAGATTIGVVLSIAGGIAVLGTAYGALKLFGGDAVRAGRAIKRLLRPGDAVNRAPVDDQTALHQPAPAEPTKEQIRVLNAIHDRTLDDGELPVFRVVDKQLDLEGLKLRELIESMPPALMQPDLTASPHILRDDDRLKVTLDGLRHCERGSEALDLLGQSLAYLAERERPFIPTSKQPTLTVTTSEIQRAVGLSDGQLRQARVLIYLYSHQSWTGMSGQHSDWSITVSPEYVRRFRGVRNGDQYLLALGGESFDHQSAATIDS